MTVVQIAQAPNRAEYERVAKIVDLAGTRPAGLILHAATELPSGEIQIIDVFETAEHLAAFGQQRIFPAFAEAGILERMKASPMPAAHEAFDLVR